MNRTVAGQLICRRYHQTLQLGILTHKARWSDYECPVGFVHVATPVWMGERHVATLVGGQVFRRRPNNVEIARLAKLFRRLDIPVDRNHLVKVCGQSCVLTVSQIRAVEELLIVFAELLADSAYRWMVEGNENEPTIIRKARAYVRQEFAAPLSIGDLARHVHVSARQLERVWKSATGQTPVQFVTRVRIDRAKEMLVSKELRISELAYASGFESIQHFNRVFKSQLGVSPTQYRKSQYTAKSKPRRPIYRQFS